MPLSAQARTCIEEAFAACGEVEWIEAFIVDVNGIARGKIAPADRFGSVVESGLAMPRSLYAQDIFGQDVEAAGLAVGSGDPDGLCFPVPGTIVPVPWAGRPTAQMLLSMEGPEGGSFFADSRAMLERQIARLGSLGLSANVAVELEFYLVADALGPVVPAGAVRPGKASGWPGNPEVMAMDVLDEHRMFLDAVFAACERQGLAVEAALHECGPGQFEINLHYVSNAALAADQAVMFKRLVKAIARRHGSRACFMAKPFGDQSGSGMHVHVSLCDSSGAPYFAMSDGNPTPALSHAIGGLIASAGDAMLLFAPHANSYRRFRRNSHVPLTAGWGWGDRSAAIRAIAGVPAAVRVEHRIAGADANPYLVTAAVLAGVIDGIEQRRDPGMPQDPALPTAADAASLPLEWGSAIDRFAQSEFIARAFGANAQQLLAACKQQDFDIMLGRVTEVEFDAYLAAV